MRRLLVLALTVVAAGVLLPAPPASAGAVVLGGVRVGLAPGTRQVVTVNHTHGWHASVSMWRLTGTRWHRVLYARDGRTGYGGLVTGSRRHQGTGATPLGTYRLLDSFGRHARRTGWDLPYRQIRSGDYWVEDNASAYYNRFRTKSQGGFRWWLKKGPDTSERLADYPGQYEYAINTGFNYEQVRHRGAGIFLHVNGRGATAGCVSVPRGTMRQLLARLDPHLVPVIAIGR